MKVRKLQKVYAFDIDKLQAENFTQEFQSELTVIAVTPDELDGAVKDSQIVVTCTPSKQPFLHADVIMPGTFIAAVGADSEEKQELYSQLICSNKLVVDLLEQSASIGELHHAIAQGLMTTEEIHAELGMIVAGKKAGRQSDKEIIIFDSTGMALQDVAAASIVYEKALSNGIGTKFNFSLQ
jgi:ornithine cyclodeaminase/alanine dehydrogenase